MYCPYLVGISLQYGHEPRTDQRRPRLSVAGYKVVCYLEAWAAYRKDVVAYSAHNVDPFACTHLLYAFASIDPHSFRVVPQDEEYDLVKGGYRAAVGLKRKNPALKVMLSVGGWMEGSSKFSQMASRADRRREFIRSVVRILDAHRFDGLDLDWEYPGTTHTVRLDLEPWMGSFGR